MTAAALAVELPRRTAALRSGGDASSAAWLVEVQSAAGAWEVCVEVLRHGPRSDLDGEFLDAFCAQTLATWARALTSRVAEAAQQQFLNACQDLLGVHVPPRGRPVVWRQLALAMTCAELWLGIWSPAMVLQADASLAPEVRAELLMLPTELLFCERALPLSDVALWQHSAAGLLEACGPVINHLLSAALTPGAGATYVSRALQVLAAWLRAARLAFEWVPQADKAAPLRSLAAHVEALLLFASAALSEAAEVAQQLARWRRCDAEVTPLLAALLGRLLSAGADFGGGRKKHEVLMPLLADLANDRWPRAVLGDITLDWRPIAQQAQAALREAAAAAAAEGGEEAGRDAEAALAVWQGFALTCRMGTREWDDEAEYGGPHSEWFMPREQVVCAEVLPQLFVLLAGEVLELLRLPSSPRADEIRSLVEVRSAAQGALAAWASLMGDSVAWHQATWAPLERVGRQLTAAGAGGLSEDVLREAEVILWLSFTLAASWPEKVGAAPAANAVLELGPAIDAAPEPWRSLLCSAACELAATGPPEKSPQFLEWMLLRPPYSAGSLPLLEFTELPFAQALEQTCKQLPPEFSHASAAERVLQLALAEVPPSALHRHSSKARALLLRCLRHTMGGDAAMLCQGLSAQIVPGLYNAAVAEATQAQSSSADLPWHAARTLIATLEAVLPPAKAPVSDPGHPVIALWRGQWPFLEAALLRWPSSPISDQPLAAAAEALGTAAARAPALLPEALALLSQSMVARSMPDAQLKALRAAILEAPCPPLDAAAAAPLLAEAVLRAADGALRRGGPDLGQSPTTLAALFALLEGALAGPRQGGEALRLWPLLLSQAEVMGRCVQLLCSALPGCASAEAAEQMLRFANRLLSVDRGRQIEAHQQMLRACLPNVCGAVCRALAAQEHMASWEGLVTAAELLWTAADALPEELEGALFAGLETLGELPAWSRMRMGKLVLNRAEWPKRSAWICEVHQLVQEWQREYRQGAVKRSA
mmetsp:Transcript_46141/g.147360  ORF Transcript_46141/g.147360 Transcript_46141/m.147360 type:complete len:996 (+) Transcript_46141:54-3041(+)